MTVPSQTALTLPRTGLGASLGQGVQQGVSLGLQTSLKKFLQQQKTQATLGSDVTKQRQKNADSFSDDILQEIDKVNLTEAFSAPAGLIHPPEATSYSRYHQYNSLYTYYNRPVSFYFATRMAKMD